MSSEHCDGRLSRARCARVTCRAQEMSDEVAFAIVSAQGRRLEVRKHMLEDKYLMRGGMAHDEVVDALCAMTLKHFSDFSKLRATVL